MKEELKEEWIKLIHNLEIPAETIYILLNPINRDDFMQLVNKLTEQMFKLKHDGSIDIEVVKKFKLLAIQYLIEFEKDNRSSYTPAPSIVTYPTPNLTPVTTPVSPSCPYQLPIIYCTTTC